MHAIIMNENRQRQVRSFVRRIGRVTLRQENALKNAWNTFGLSSKHGFYSWETVFGRDAERVLEIGFGMGQSLIQMAISHPEKDFIGVEVHKPGVGALLADLVEKNIQNIRIFHEDVLDVLKLAIEDQSLSLIQIFFPDPWQKRRHHKRRLIQPEFIDLLSTKLVTGGQLHLATDWEDYARWMMDVLENSPHFTNVYNRDQYMPTRGDRPETKFERRGKRLGHGVWDLLFSLAKKP